MKIIIAIGAFCFLVFCANKTEIQDSQGTQIRVINATEESFSNVVLFSMKFGNLKPQDTSAYQILDYDPLIDDTMIYCSIDNDNYSRYLEIPAESVKNFSYKIDSIQDGIMYVTSIYED
tara:strand:+ start:12785 stop:13141 length:357 start_codon:yes stop_codon:yes gene_type:complete